jgi:serine/threonine-protein kinase
LGGGVAWLVTRAHHGTGQAPASLIQPLAALQPVSLCQSCAHGFNPLGNPLDEAPNASLAIDNTSGTYWDTQLYFDHKLEKAGTGLYVDASPGLVAKQLRIVDATPGFTVTIYARSDPPPATAAPPSGWTQVSASTQVGSSTAIPLNTQGTSYRYYLVWITDIGGHEQLSLDEVTLYR